MKRLSWRVRLDKRISSCEMHARWIWDGLCPECIAEDHDEGLSL